MRAEAAIHDDEEGRLSEVERSLNTLAEEINTEHEAFRQAFKATYRSALRAGDLLTEAKERVQHGEWQAWVTENCAFSMRTAQNYMRLAANRGAVEAQLKSAEPAHLTIEGALRALAEPTTSHTVSHETEDADGIRTVVALETFGPPREPTEPVALEDALKELDDRAKGLYEHHYRQQEEEHGTEAAQAWLGERMRIRENLHDKHLKREYEKFEGKPEYVADQLYEVVTNTTARFEDIPEKNPMPEVLDAFEWRRVLALIGRKRDERAAADVEGYVASGGVLGAKAMRKDLEYVLRNHQMANVKRLPDDVELLRTAGRNYAAMADALEAGSRERHA